MSKQKFTKEELRDKLDGNELDLSLCNLSKVPVREIAALPKATTLDLSCNVLTVLPPTFPTLTQLTRLDLSKNNLTELPSDFGRLVNLERLDLFSNKLEDLPISCAHLKKLKWLDLKGNPIETSLPDVVGNCLSAAECKECANNMISYLKVKNAEQERKRQKKLKDEREKNALKAANVAKEKELRKRQKLLEKQQKREAYEALEKEKKLLAQESEQDPEDYVSVQDEALSKAVKLNRGEVSPFLVLIICFIICSLLFYCYKMNYFDAIEGKWD